MSDSTRGLVPCDRNFSKYASLQSDVAQLKMHRSTIGTLDVSICFNMFQYVSICFNTVQACGHAHFIGVLSTSCVLHTGLSTQGSGNTTPCPTTLHSFSLLKLTPQPQCFDLPGRLDDIFQSAKLHTLGRSPYSSPLSP